MEQPELSDIIIYPLKSACEIYLKHSFLEQRGLVYDRRWMVVDDSGKFITQRTRPEMALIKTEIVDRVLRLNAPGMAELELPLLQTEGIPKKVEIWGDHCDALVADKQAKIWISNYLGKRCNFVFMPDYSNRHVDQDYAVGINKVSFSDGFPLLLISESSLFDLKSRVYEEINMNRFRPNLVIKNTDPYQEDNWETIRIGGCELQIVKPCSRCVMTTIDPETGKFSGKEPLKTLAKYRNLNGKIVFGQNLIPLTSGKIEVGMKLEILETNN